MLTREAIAGASLIHRFYGEGSDETFRAPTCFVSFGNEEFLL